MSDKIIFQNNLSKEHFEKAAELYAEAFEQKFLKIIGKREEVIELLKNNLRSDRAIVSLSEDNKLLGLAGLNYDGKPFIDLEMQAFWSNFGYLKGSVKAIASEILFSRTPVKGELLMDGIVVSEDFRGKGIGKNLFQKIVELAKEKNYKQIRLDVIDENPRAKKLYEKLGFEPIKHEDTKYLKNLIGVSGVTTMIKKM